MTGQTRRTDPEPIIRVAIVDDHPVVRWGYRQMLATDPSIRLVAEIEDASRLLDQIRALDVHVILLDIRMPGITGLEAVGELRRRRPSVRLLILTIFDDSDLLYEALAAGVDGYLLKSASRDVVVDAIHCVHAGRRIVDPSLMHLVLDHFSELARSRLQQHVFTADERRLLELLASGSPVAAISQQMHWSVATVGRRINQVCEKLGVENRVQAVREATRLRLV